MGRDYFDKLMEIQILLAGVEFGPYTDDKARELIADGFLAATDPAKRIDETEWLPLTEVLARPPEDAEPETDTGEEPPAFPEETGAADPIAGEEDFSPDSSEPHPGTFEEEPQAAPVAAEPEPEPQPTPPLPPIKRPALRRDPTSIPAPPKTLPVTASRPLMTPSAPEPIPPAPPLAARPSPVPAPPPAPRSIAPPMINVTVPARFKAKGTVRTTGSLLAKEALQAARARLGGGPPAALTAPLPEPPPARPEPPAPEPPAPEVNPEPEAPTKTRSKIVLKNSETEDAGETSAARPRKTIRLTQPISLVPGAVPPPPPPATPENKVRPPSLKIPEPTFAAGKILVGQMRTKPLSLGRRTGTLETVKAPPPPAPTPEDNPEIRQELPHPTAEATPLPPTGTILIPGGDTTEKRSLKITGALKQTAPRTPVRLTTSFPYKPGDSGKVALREEPPTAARPVSGPVAPVKRIWGPEAPASRPNFQPTAKIPPPAPALEPPRLDTRPPSTKIPVSEMPPEGLKVRSTRRLTGRIPMPEAPKAPAEPVVEKPAEAVVETPPEAPVQAFAPPAEPAAEIVPPVTDEPPPVAEALAPTPEVAKPEKTRLRRPVKLELTSRPKLADTGKISLEAFSKMAPVESPTSRPPSQFLPPLDVEAPPAPRPGLAQGESEGEYPGLVPAETRPMPETVPLMTVEEPPAQKLREIRVLKVPLLPPRRRDNWLWVAYAIIAAGMLAWLLLLYLATHRRNPPPPPETPPPAVSAPAPTPAPAPTVSPAASVPTPAPAATATTAPATPSAPPAPDLSQQVNAYVTDGISSFQKGDLDSALAAFNHALDLDPKSADALYNRGLTKAAQDDSDGAISDYSQALQLNSKMAPAYYARGLARHSKGDLDGALSDYNLAIQNDPHDALAFFNRGLIRMQKDDIDGAVVDSGRALELDPRLIQSYYNRGLGRLAKGSLDSALSDMKTFCTLAPQDAYTDYARLYIWLIRTQQNQLAEANQELTQAMNSGWNGSADAMVTKIGEFLLGQISEQDLLTAASSPIPVKDQGQHCEAWYFIGMRRLESGDKESAAVDLRKCVETQKTDYCEYILAQEELKILDPTGAATSTVTPAPGQ